MIKPLTNNFTRILVAAATLSVSLASVAQNERVALPELGASADTILSRKDEEEYAKALVRQMRAYEVLNEDPLITAYFEDMGFRLVAHSDRPDKQFTFTVIDQPVVNAFLSIKNRAVVPDLPLPVINILIAGISCLRHFPFHK